MISTKRFFCSIVMGLLACQMASVASATLVALTENIDAGYYKSPDASMATFAGAIAPTFAATDDTFVTTNPAANYNKTLGDNLQFSTSTNMIKFDLSAIPTGATITEAKLQLFSRSGNTVAGGTSIGKIVTKTWNEDDLSKAGPNVVSPNLGWGPLGDGTTGGALFDYAVDVPSTTNFTIKTVPAFGGGAFPFPSYLTSDVTADVQDFLDNTNFGWGFVSGNRAPYQSTPAVGAGGLDKTYPVLFVDYEVTAVPEPSSFLLLGLTSLGLMVGKRRRV